MKKMPTLFVREFEKYTSAKGERINVIKTLNEVTSGCEWVINGEGIATEKMDGSCCAVINGLLYKRYDAKQDKKPPEGAIPCQEHPDKFTGHWPHWVLVDKNKPEDKWFWEAYKQSRILSKIEDGTYEALGFHFQGNPYSQPIDFIEKHGRRVLEGVPRDYEGIKEYLRNNNIEGIVFHRENGDMCKIKRSDFGFRWNSKKNNRKV